MSDTIPNIFTDLPTRETIKADLAAPLGFQTADGGFRTAPDNIDRLRRFITVAERYSRFALVSGAEHGEGLEKVRYANERTDEQRTRANRLARKNKRLKASLKMVRGTRDRLIAAERRAVTERDEAREALADAMRERTDHLSAIRALSLALGVSFENGLKFRHIEFHKPSNLTSNPSMEIKDWDDPNLRPGYNVTIVNPLGDAKEAATRIVKSIQEISRPIGEAREVKPDAVIADGQIQVTPGGAFDRPTVGQSEPPTQIKTNRVEYLRRGDVIRFNHEDRTVTCIHHFGRDVQVCMADTDDVSSQPFFKTDRETLVDVVEFGATTPEPEPEIPDEPVAVAAGGWCAPGDALYSMFPEIKVERGGISFTKPKPRTKKQLRAENNRLLDSLTAERKRTRKLERKVRRLSKAVKRLARA